MILNSILNIHFYLALGFLFYILLDRIYIRNFLEVNLREQFYKKVKYYMLGISLFLLFSGIYLLYSFFSIFVVIKAIMAIVLLVSFFYCPLFMKKECSVFKRLMYRYWVLILTISTFLFGLYVS